MNELPFTYLPVRHRLIKQSFLLEGLFYVFSCPDTMGSIFARITLSFVPQVFFPRERCSINKVYYYGSMSDNINSREPKHIEEATF